jgi:hypothetical protein
MTTHIGSSPRGAVLTELLLAEDSGDVIDGDAFQRAVNPSQLSPERL